MYHALICYQSSSDIKSELIGVEETLLGIEETISAESHHEAKPSPWWFLFFGVGTVFGEIIKKKILWCSGSLLLLLPTPTKHILCCMTRPHHRNSVYILYTKIGYKMYSYNWCIPNLYKIYIQHFGKLLFCSYTFCIQN